MPADLFPGFKERRFDLGNVELYARIGGRGPALVLLHGYPQTHVAWHAVAPTLAAYFTLIVPDLRGYGRSSCPPSDIEHRAYSSRAMAGDIAALMAVLEIPRFAVMGHNRGARVAYRLALDQPRLVTRLVLLDIMTNYDHWGPNSAQSQLPAPRWGFLAQPAPIPESLIGADPDSWIDGYLRSATLSGSLDAFAAPALADYRRSLADPDHIHASCEDFRAGVDCDVADDREDLAAGRNIVAPALLVRASSGNLVTCENPLASWRRWCHRIDEVVVESGHYLHEENPGALLAGVLPFLTASEAPT